MLPQRCKQVESTSQNRSSKVDLGGYECKYDTNDNSAALSWRAHPKGSHSDWTIELKCEDDGEEEVTSFHTHKCVLAAGKYRSAYFQRLFQNTIAMRETNTSTSTISLKRSSFEAFPEVLDHVYTGACGFTTEHAVALLSLSDYFGIPTLFRDAKRFIEGDMEKSNVHIYYTEAVTYQDEAILDAAKVTCVKCFDSLSVEQVRNLTPDFLKLIIGSGELNSIRDSFLSVQIADYCRHHPQFVNACLLAEIANAKVMPHIHPSEVMFFLNLCVQHDVDTCQTSGEEQGSLQTRYIEAIQDWEVAFDDNYSNLPSEIRLEITEEALHSAKREVSQQSKEVKRLKEQVKRLKEQHNSNSEEHARQLSNADIQMQRLGQRNSEEKSLADIQMQRLGQRNLEEKSLLNKQISRLKQECRSLRRQLAKAR